MAHRCIHTKPVNFGSTDTRPHAVQLGLRPSNRKCDRRAEESVEVIGIPRVLAKVAHINKDPFTKALLDSSIVLIPAPERNRTLIRRSLKQIAGESARAGGTGHNQVL